MVAHLHLYEFMTELNKHLKYRWICTYHMDGPKATIPAAQFAAAWKPILIYTRPDARNLRFINSDYFHAANRTSDGISKEYHHWQQSLDGFTELVQRFTEPADTVLDPFMGSGTTGVACLYLNRRFIGCDNDPLAVAVATKRIRETYGVLSSSATARLV
jgi:DNA modification methylase